jgi:hypothetical protein
MNSMRHLIRLCEVVDPTTLGSLTTHLPDQFYHMTHDQAMVDSIVKSGFDLKMFGYTGKKFNSHEWTKFDPAGVYCQDASEIHGRFTPWLTFTLTGNPTALASPHHFLNHIAAAYGCIGRPLSRQLLRQGISVIQNVGEFIILDTALIQLVDWSGRSSTPSP